MRNLVKVSIEGKMYLAKQAEDNLFDYMVVSNQKVKDALTEYLRRELKGTLSQINLSANVGFTTMPLDDVELAALDQVENTLKRAEACALKYLTVQVFDTLLGEN